MDKIIERALEHWYAPEHELYNDPLPALMGIVGESGELCDLWKKKLYKPGYVFDEDEFIDELGDCLFYVAVLCHYANIDFRPPDGYYPKGNSILDDICDLNVTSSLMLQNVIEFKKEKLNHHKISRMAKAIHNISDDLGIVIIRLSELNHTKLNERAANGEGYNRGNEKEQFVICDSAIECKIKCYHKSKHSTINEDYCNCLESEECILNKFNVFPTPITNAPSN